MKRICKLALVMIMLFGFALITKAAGTASSALSATKTSVKAGETFEVTVAVTSESRFYGGHLSYTYDKNALELKNITKAGEVFDVYSTDRDSNFTGEISFTSTNTGATGKANIAKFTFKAKTDFTVGATTNVGISGGVVGDRNNNESQVSASTITITRIAGTATDEDSAGGKDSDSGSGSGSGTTALQYGIKTEDGEELDDGLKNVKYSTPSASATPTSITIYPKADASDKMCLVYRSTKVDSGFTKVGSKVKCSGAYGVTDKGLTPGTTYYYRVRVLGSEKISDAYKITTKDASKYSAEVKPIDTGAATPIAAIALLGLGFVVTKKVTNKDKFSRI